MTRQSQQQGGLWQRMKKNEQYESGMVGVSIGILTGVSRGTSAGVGLEAAKAASAAIEARIGVAGVGHDDLAERRREAHGTRAREGGRRSWRRAHVAGTSVLTAWTRVARVRVLAVFAHVHRRAAATTQTTLHWSVALTNVESKAVSNIF